MDKKKKLESVKELDLDYSNSLEYFTEEVKNTKKVNNAVDAQYLSRNDMGGIDLTYMAQISGLSENQLIAELEGTYMWKDPKNPGEWKTREQMTQGNISDALKITEKAQKRYGGYEANLKLLKEIVPDAPLAEEIEMSLASPWIPITYKRQFLQEITNMVTPPKMELDEFTGKYRIEPGLILDDFNNVHKYGTSRITCVKIAEKTINAIPIIIRDSVERYDRSYLDYVENEGETQLARKKQKDLCEAFRNWISSQPDVEARLCTIYSEKYSYIVCRYNGDHLSLPGLNTEVHLYKHQKDAIERIIASGQNTYLAHDVGAGKTYEFEIGVHELLRLGIVKKAMIVVPNQVLDATVKSWEYLYPGEPFMAVYPKDFTPAKRYDVISKMKNDDSHLIFMAYSSFDMLTMSRQYYLDKKKEEIQRCISARNSARSSSIRSSLDSTQERLSKAYLRMLEKLKDTETSCFDELGVDCLVVDEAHNYKNITLDYRMDGIIGMHSTGSKKADELYEKVRFITERDGRVIFASGTPITNSLADLYVIQKYLQLEELETLKISRFGEWLSTFCEQGTNFEVGVDMGYKFAKRFSHFYNLPELMALFSNICDFYQVNAKDLNLPELKSTEIVRIKKSAGMKAYMENLVQRAEDVHNHEVDRKQDNFLKITVDGRMASLDLRLVDKSAMISDEEYKVQVCAGKVVELYHRHPGMTQIVFCDISTPKKEFNIYDELKKELCALGIPQCEVAFIHDASTEGKRRSMFKEFNDGKLRVLVGSTQKLGTGCNVQERLVAIHNLDIPWRPADMEQRRGRMVRQGNCNFEVKEYNYCTIGTVDAFSYQKLESKQRFISSFLSGMLDQSHRKEEDISDAVLTYSEIKAAVIGNPLIKTRVEISNSLEHTRIAYRQRKKELLKLQELILEVPAKVEKHRQIANMFQRADAYYRNHKGIIHNDERESFGKELLDALKENINQERERVFDWYQGFQVILPAGMEAEDPYIILEGGNKQRFLVKMSTDKPMGCSKRIDYTLERFRVRREEEEQKIKVLYNQKAEAEHELYKGNAYERDMERLKRKLMEIDKKLEEGKTA